MKSKAEYAESSYNKFLETHGINQHEGYVERIFDILPNVTPTEDDMQKKTKFVQHIRPIIQTTLKNEFETECEVVPVGSFTTGFDVAGSDLDVTIILPNVVSKEVMVKMLDRLKEVMELDESVFRKFFIVRWGNVPIMKIKAQDDTKCDICINNYLGRENSAMLRLYSTFDPRLHQLGLFTKMWAKTLELGESGQSGLNSYTFVCMCIAYLQTRNILPNLQDEALCQDLNKKFISDFDCTYCSDPEKVNWKVVDETPLRELIAGFIRWVYEFDFKNNAVSMRCGGSTPFSSKELKSVVHIEDPFERRDLGASMSPAKFLKLREELHEAYVILSGDKEYAQIEIKTERMDKWKKKNKSK
jgi:DNA polymerase sigma